MGAWSASPFGNDDAMDFFGALDDSADTSMLSNAILKAKVPAKQADADACAKVIAAAAIVAAASLEKPTGVPADVKKWISRTGYVPTAQVINKTQELLQRIIKDSELQDLWEEQDSLKTWQKSVNGILTKLQAVDLTKLPARQPKKPGIPRRLDKLLEHPDARTDPKIRERILNALNALDDVNVESKETGIYFPLSLVIEHGFNEGIQVLIDRGARLEPNSRFGIDQPLRLATKTNNPDAVRLLLDAGAHVNQGFLWNTKTRRSSATLPPDFDVSTAIKLVLDSVLKRKEIEPGQHKKAREYYANKDDFVILVYSPALFSAAAKGSIEMIELLVERGGDLFQTNFDGWTMLHSAATGNNVAVLEYLLSKGLDPNKAAGYGETPLHLGLLHPEIVKRLLEAGADPNAERFYQGTCLDHALLIDQHEVAELLQASGGVPNEVVHMNAFIDAFVPDSHKQQWKSLTNCAPPKLEEIRPSDIWPADDNAIPHCSLLKTSIEELFSKAPYSQYRSAEVIPCGRNENAPQTARYSLQEIWEDKIHPQEGLISVVPGKLALLVNQDNDVCVFDNTSDDCG